MSTISLGSGDLGRNPDDLFSAGALPPVVRPGHIQRDDGHMSTAVESPNQLAMRRLKEHRWGQGALAVFLMMVICCISATVFENHWAGRTANEQNLSGSMTVNGKKTEVVSLRGLPQVGPGLRTEYTFGADALGRDVFMRALRGGAVSLTIGIGAAIITVILGTTIGLIAGYSGGKIDAVTSQFIDIMLAYPAMVLAIGLSMSLATSEGFLFIKRGSLGLPLLIIGIGGAPYFARIIRAKAIELSHKEFVEASRALGAGHRRVMFHELSPHLLTTIITYFGVLVSADIITEAGLSFLGVGVLPPVPSWGNMIADGRDFYNTAWWIALLPGIFIIITVLTVNIMGEALEEAFDPKSGGR